MTLKLDHSTIGREARRLQDLARRAENIAGAYEHINNLTKADAQVPRFQVQMSASAAAHASAADEVIKEHIEKLWPTMRKEILAKLEAEAAEIQETFSRLRMPD